MRKIDEATKADVKSTFNDILTIPQAAWAMGRTVPEVRAIVRRLFLDKEIIPVGKIRCNIAGRSEMRYTTNEQAALSELLKVSRKEWFYLKRRQYDMIREVVKSYIDKRFVVSGFTIPDGIGRFWPGVKSLIDAAVADAWRNGERLMDFAEDEEGEDEK